MAHLVKDLEDIMVRWEYVAGKPAKASLVSIDPVTGDVKSVKIPVKVAEMLIEHGMNSGD